MKLGNLLSRLFLVLLSLMKESDKSPAELREAVTSPGGTTAAALTGS